MAGMEAIEVAVVAEFPVVIAPVPESRSRHAVDERAVAQHRQIESTAVPRDELRSVLVDQIEEAANELRLRIVRRSDRGDLEPRAIAQRAGNRDDALMVERHEIAARLRSALLCVPIEHGVVGKRRRHVVGAAQPREIRDSFDVEDEDRRHRRHRRHAGKTPVDR